MRRKDRAAVRLLRLWFGTMSRIAPHTAERQAANLFLTPRKPRRNRESTPSPARELIVLSSGVPITGWTWGKGPTVLLVHGWSGRALDMAPLAERLADAG